MNLYLWSQSLSVDVRIEEFRIYSNLVFCFISKADISFFFWHGLCFMLVLFCLFPHPLGVWKGLRFVIVALPGLFSYLGFAL